MQRGGNKWRYSFPFPSVVRKDITPVMGWDPMIVNKINKRDIKMDVFFFSLNFSIGLVDWWTLLERDLGR